MSSALANVLSPAPSTQQARVYHWVDNGKGNGLIIAVAGAGKSTTLVWGAKRIPERASIAAVMYGKRASVDFQRKLDDNGLDKVKCGTAHSFGFRAWMYANRGANIVVDEKGKWQQIFQQIQVPEHLQNFVQQLVSLGKQRAVGYLSNAQDTATWKGIVDHFGLEYELSGNGELNDAQVGDDVDLGIGFAAYALRVSNQLAREVIDQDDMIYMPLVANVRMWQNDWLLVDEAQDTNPARRALYKKMLKPGGRALFVGDPHQAIFGFTGADNDALKIIKREFNAQELPLTVSFRCAKSVIRHAQNWVSHIEAHPSNKEGRVYSIKWEEFITKFGELRPTDAIVCRNTKPLVDLAFRIIRAGVPCHVEGKEIGQGLIALASKWKISGLEALRNKLGTWLSKQVQKLLGKGQEETAERLTDRVETLQVIMDSMPPGSKVGDLHRKIDDMFKTTPEGTQSINLTLCTIHKSKGLEWDNVYLLGRNRYMPSPFARQAWQMDQENNLTYVAITRAKTNLIEIEVPPLL